LVSQAGEAANSAEEAAGAALVVEMAAEETAEIVTVVKEAEATNELG
jgi:hypothetical protein